MGSKRGLLRGCHLCVILDSGILGKRDIVRTARLAIRGGADMIQLRAKKAAAPEMIKTAAALKRLARRCHVAFVINDRLDVAVAVGADGVHIGQGDIGAGLARKMMGPGKLIGLSAGTAAQVIMAGESGADYLGIGPVFGTPVKASRRAIGLGFLEKAKRAGVPFFAIGGINTKNVTRLTEKGFNRIAVIRAICRSRDPRGAARRLKESLVR